MHALVVAGATSIDLGGSWSSLWAVVNQGDWATLSKLLSWFGVGLIVFAIIKFFWDKRRGGGAGGGGSQAVLYSAIFGGLLAAPELLIPALLGVLDLVINLFLRLISAGG